MQKARKVVLFLCFCFGCLHAQRKVKTSPHLAHSMNSLEVLSRLLLAGNSAVTFNLKRPNDFGSRAHNHYHRRAVPMAGKGTPEAFESVVEFVNILTGSEYTGWKKQVGKATALVETGAVDLSACYSGKTALHFAALEGEADLVRKIINAGADINAATELRGSEGTTALMWAAMYGRTEVCKVLLELGADTTLREKGGKTAIELAEEYNRHPSYKNAEIITLLKR
jgi:hypothetical protein